MLKLIIIVAAGFLIWHCSTQSDHRAVRQIGSDAAYVAASNGQRALDAAADAAGSVIENVQQTITGGSND